MRQSLSTNHAFNMLCHLAQAKLENQSGADISGMVNGHSDWEHVFQLSEAHQIYPLVYHSVIDASIDGLAAEHINRLKQRCQKEAVHNLFLTKELGRLLKVLGSNDIKAMALKGPVLAQLAYGDLNMRSYMDMDILIEPQEYNNVRKLLRDDSYTIHPRLESFSSVQEKIYVLQNAQFPFVKGALTYRLDLHTRIMPPLMQYRMKFDGLWDRSKEICVAGTSMRTFEPEDMLLVLCFHGVKNRWETLKYVCDLTGVIRSVPELNWDVIFKRAHKMKSLRTLVLGLRLAKSLLDAPVPPWFYQAEKVSKDLDEITAQLISRLSQRKRNDTMKFHERIHFYMTIQDTFFARLKYITHALLRRLDTMLPGNEWSNVGVR